MMYDISIWATALRVALEFGWESLLDIKMDIPSVHAEYGSRRAQPRGMATT